MLTIQKLPPVVEDLRHHTPEQLLELRLLLNTGVLGRADEFVETAPEFAVLAKRLLGKTWIVESLAHALSLAESAGRGLNFVTRAGELIAADGTMYVGPRHSSTGLISRRSELRVLLTLAQGLGGKEAADMLGVSEPTVRTHLQHIFAKTGTSRQTELLRLLHNATPPIGAPQQAGALHP